MNIFNVYYFFRYFVEIELQGIQNSTKITINSKYIKRSKNNIINTFLNDITYHFYITNKKSINLNLNQTIKTKKQFK